MCFALSLGFILCIYSSWPETSWLPILTKMVLPKSVCWECFWASKTPLYSHPIVTYVSHAPIPHERWPCSALSPVLNCHLGVDGPHIYTTGWPRWDGDLSTEYTWWHKVTYVHIMVNLFAFRILFHQTFHKKVIREGFKKSKWKFKMAFAIRGLTPPP